MKISITTLGCKVNQAESAYIEGALREKGHEIVASADNPDACIINTCTVTAKSDYQSRQMIRRAVKSGARVIATGCYAQLRPEELLKIQGIDFIVGNSQKDKLHEYLYKLSPENIKTKNQKPDKKHSVVVRSPETPMMLGPYFSNRARAFLKIQDGCNFSCSYCTVPMARGKSRSLNPEEVLKAAEKFNADGYKEIVLTGIHIGSYGLDLDPESSLLEIVGKTANAYPLLRIRLSSIEPREFKKDFLSLIKQEHICPHLHIPLQSGSDKILKAMNRGYSRKFFRGLVNDIVSELPDISIGTDIIVGFPGESEKDFNETTRLLEELPLSYVHVFPYSKRSGTRAAALPGQVNKEVKKGRVNDLLTIGKKKKNDYVIKQLGKRLNVIVEGKGTTEGFYRVISDNYIRPLVRADNLVSGQRLMIEAVSYINGELISTPVKV